MYKKLFPFRLYCKINQC